MRTKILQLAFVLAILALAQTVHANGKLYARFPNQENSPVFDLRLQKFKADVEIQDQLAVVHLDETFFNDRSSQMEGIYFLELPEGSKVTEMALWINGERVEHEIKRREEAVQEYEEIVRRSIDPLLAEEIGPNVFRLRIFPLLPNDSRRIEITYVQPLPATGDLVEFLFPLILEDYDAGATDSASIDIDLKSQFEIASVDLGAQVPPNSTDIERVDDRHYRVSFLRTGSVFTYDFSLNYRHTEAAVFTPLAYHDPESGEDPVFLLWAQPPADFFGQADSARSVVLCVDVSASMIGEKLSGLKQALITIVSRLDSDDHFNIIAFNNNTKNLAGELVAADSSNKQAAIQFIQTLSATGLTNMNAALLHALGMFAASGQPQQILLISDGEPTAGETDPDRILRNVSDANAAGVQIFPIGIGPDTDADFFRQLAQENRGNAFFIEAIGTLRDEIELIYEQVSVPILTDVEITQTGVTTYDVLPEPLPNVPKGATVRQAGRFLAPGSGTLELRAQTSGGLRTAAEPIDWQEVPQSLYATRLWAAAKIADLEDEIDELGENAELVDAIVLLSQTYSVLSRYTAFLVVEPGADGPTAVDDQPAVPEAFTLFPNFPNPFNPETTIRFVIPAGADCSGCPVTLEIYNVLGEKIRALVNEPLAAGEHALVWDGRDEAGTQVASGVYLYKLKFGEFVKVRRMLLLR